MDKLLKEEFVDECNCAARPNCTVGERVAVEEEPCPIVNVTSCHAKKTKKTAPLLVKKKSGSAKKGGSAKKDDSVKKGGFAKKDDSAKKSGSDKKNGSAKKPEGMTPKELCCRAVFGSLYLILLSYPIHRVLGLLCPPLSLILLIVELCMLTGVVPFAKYIKKPFVRWYKRERKAWKKHEKELAAKQKKDEKAAMDIVLAREKKRIIEALSHDEPAGKTIQITIVDTPAA